jgi:uncharacterized protein
MLDDKPIDIIGRAAEWNALRDFSLAETPQGGVGLLYGRRRTGKSFLLRRLVTAAGGIYFQATESDRSVALHEFGQAVAAAESEVTGREAEPISYADWDDALRRRSGLVVIDELPYLLRHSPELPSLLQRIVDESTHGSRPPIRFIVCGSSLSVMTSLLQGQEPLRGRATLDLFLRPMDHRGAAAMWGVEDHEVAVRLHAIFGGSPGYRALTSGLPTSVDELGRWLSTNVLNPAHALYREDDYLLNEERTITDRALYGMILRSIASGVATQTELAGRLNRSRESLTHPLSTLTRSGFVIKDEDVITQNRPEHRLVDPIIRFLQLVVEPARHLLDEGRWDDVWKRSAHRLDANVFGPHLESIAHRWAELTFTPAGGDFVTAVGHTRVPDPATRKSIDLDLVALGTDTNGRAAIHLIGEVKWSAAAFGGAAIDRLARARELLGKLGHDISRCQLALISRSSPTHPGEGLRVDLNQLYST